ncbi:heparinase II/III family protein [Halomarina oriensis]|uniref:Alginate lyase domain-containing protein n=1 Tax=Halomarina oriensis TaxID=671145 RepID=A0A6B0GJ37_9EURY|nr:heparinase II/III family protein [Halomarina oriensis]MWG33831.1 hypothetical protein [Halomarina oriensis]
MSQDSDSHGQRGVSRSVLPDLTRRRFTKFLGAAGAAGAVGSWNTPVAAQSAGVPVEESDITKQQALDSVEYGLEHPRVYHAADEVSVARDNAENTEWGARLKEQVVALTTDYPFKEMSREELFAARPVVAPDGQSYYTMPFGGNLLKGSMSPVDGSELKLAGWDRPGEVVDDSGNVFPGTVDGVDLNDDGSGVEVDPEEVPDDWAAAEELDEPQTFWFIAKYNGLVAKAWARWINAYAYSYVLTREQKYAEVVATILDALGESVPTSFDYVVDRGPYPWFETEPKQKPAVLYRNMYSYSRIVQKFVNAMDLVWGSGELERPSQLHDDVTIKKNATENVVVESVDWMWRDMHGGLPEKNLEHANYAAIYHNGTADFNKGFVAASSLLSLDAGYAKWALDGQVSLQNFLANTVFRDGSYFETSSLYSVSLAEWARLAYYLSNDAYPDGVNLYDEPRFVNLNVRGPRRQSVAGRIPHYGDVSQVDLGVDTEPLRGDFSSTLRFYARAADEATRNEYAQTLAEIAGGDPNDQLLDLPVSAYRTEEHMWPLFNIDGSIEGYDLSDLTVEQRDSELLEGKGMTMYRSDAGTDRGAMLRYGATLSHGHYDELGLWIYGAGRDLTFDPGQKPKDDFRQSFQLQTVAHHTTVVNETSSVPNEDDGGSVKLFASREGYTVSEVSNPDAYGDEGVDEYRRLTALVDSGAVSGGGSDGGDPSSHYQVDLVTGEPEEQLGETPDDFYSDQGRLVRYVHGHGDSVTAHGGNGVTDCVDSDAITVDGGTASVSLSVGESCEETLSLVSYAKPGSGFDRERASEQELVDAVTVTVGPGDHSMSVALPGAASSGSDESSADVADGPSYLFDVFRVAGGESADFSFHGKGTDFSTSLGLSEPAEGSVASPDYFWGDKVGDNGNVEGYEDESRAVVPPGNGYGFLGQPQSAPGDETWSATWAVEDDGPPAALRLTMLPDDDRKILVSNGPDKLVELVGKDPSETSVKYLLARDGGDAQFVSVIEPVGDSFPVASVESIETSDTDGQFDPVAAKVTLDDGRVDYFLSSANGEEFTANIGGGDLLQTDAAFAMVRTDGSGEVRTARMEGGTRLMVKFGGGRPMMVEGSSAAHEGSVVAVDEEGESLHIDADLPTGDALAGQYLLLDHPDYSHNSPYRIERVESIDGGSRVVLEELTIALSRGSITSVEGNTAMGPTEFPFTHTEGPQEEDDANEYFDGKQLATSDGDVTTIENTEPSYTDLTVTDTTGLSKGDTFRVLDVKAGDTATLPSSVQVRRVDGAWTVSANSDVDIKPPK